MINLINFTQKPNIKSKTINSIKLPTKDRNYYIFDQKKVNYYVSQKEEALPYIKKVLQTSKDEKKIIEALYITDRLIENGTKGIDKMYPIFAKYNNTKSPSIQTFLAGIYRKTQVPDAFGPLVKMLIQNSILVNENNIHNKITLTFDPNEEIGGAILEYIRNYSSNNTKKINYNA